MSRRAPLLLLVLGAVICGHAAEFRLCEEDIAVGGFAVSLLAAGELIYLVVPPPADIPDPQDVNPLDRWGMFEYSEASDLLSDLTEYASLALPGLALFGADMRELSSVAVMYAESLLFMQALKDMLKGMTRRYRPYMYQTVIPAELADSRDRYLSFPSGHTAAAFTGAAFAATVFAARHPASPWRVPLSAAAFGLAGATATLRVLAGKHFITDVAAGAVLGTASGIIVPLLHRRRSGAVGWDGRAVDGTGGRFRPRLAVAPGGLAITMSY